MQCLQKREGKTAASLFGKQDLWFCWDLLKRNIIRFCFVFSLRNLCPSINYSSIQDLGHDRVKISVTVLSFFPCSSKQSSCVGLPNDPWNIVLLISLSDFLSHEKMVHVRVMNRRRAGKENCSGSSLSWEERHLYAHNSWKQWTSKKRPCDNGHTKEIKMFFLDMCLLTWNWHLCRPRGMMLTVDCPARAWIWPPDCWNEL